jgi:pheromone shutdown-related protein TraB
MSSPVIDESEQNIHRVTFPDGSLLVIVGTAHVSMESVDLVRRIIGEEKPDTVCVELDEARMDALMKENMWENLDVIRIIRTKQLFFLIGQFILSSFQKRIAEKTGSAPGDEFRAAIQEAEHHGSRVACVDRNIGVTLKRAWRLTSFWQKMKILASLFTEKDEEIENLDIESIKSADAIEELVKGFEEELPGVKNILIDERDTYLAGKIMEERGEKSVAVVGAGHVPGILKLLDNPPGDQELEEIDTVPPPSALGKVLPWVIPVVVIGLITWGFFSGRREVAGDVVLYWILVNGTLSALGCMLALAHPVTILAGFLAAPLTSLNPTIGAGFVTALVQALTARPRVRDLEQIRDQVLGIRQWWSNRLTRLFLVFIFSSIGSSIGTFVALPALRRLIG